MIVDDNEPFVPPLPSASSAASFKSKRSSGVLIPLLFGFFLVILASAAIGVVYYKNKLVATTTSSPTPVPTSTISPSLEPSPTPSLSPSMRSSSTPRPTRSPAAPAVASPRPSPSPTPTPTPSPSLDIRFGNPSANVKQTIDEGSGDGRVINREYTSIQYGGFDEVSATWTPRVTVCFHIVSNENITGSDLKFTYVFDGATVQEGDLGQYDKLEAGRLYDWCHDASIGIGGHTAKLTLNPARSMRETGYVNNVATLSYQNIADNIAPNFTIMGPTQESEGTCLFPQYVTDNVTSYADLKIEEKINSGEWQLFNRSRTCIQGASGEETSYTVRVTDQRGNFNEQKKSFVLY